MKIRTLSSKRNTLLDLFLIGMFLSYAVLVISDFTMDGAGIQNLLFGSNLDTWMDFFSSVQYTKGAVPYSYFGTVYPPLANLFFYVIFCWLPSDVKRIIPTTMYDIMVARGTGADLRTIQSSLMVFFAVLFLTLLGCYVMFRSLLAEERCAGICALSLIFSYGFLYAIERGNIILLSCALTIFFFRHYRSERFWLRELAMLALAAAAGLKLYPAVFGVLYLRERNYKCALRLILYGVLMFILPAFVFEGIDAITGFIRILGSFTGTGGHVFTYMGLQGISKAAVYWGNQLLGSGSVQWEALTGLFGKIQQVSYLLAMVLIVMSLFESQNWRRLLLLTMAMLEVQQTTGYTLCFLTIPLVYCILEERQLTRRNGVEFFLMLALILPLPIWGLDIPIYGYPGYTGKTLCLQLAFAVLTIWLLIRQSMKLTRAYILKR